MTKVLITGYALFVILPGISKLRFWPIATPAVSLQHQVAGALLFAERVYPERLSEYWRESLLNDLPVVGCRDCESWYLVNGIETGKNSALMFSHIMDELKIAITAEHTKGHPSRVITANGKQPAPGDDSQAC